MNDAHAGSREVPVIRDSVEADVEAIQKIYAHYVLHGVSTFAQTPPTTAELIERRAMLLEAGMPYLVATLQERVVGYCYANPYRGRPAYRFTVENSVYIDDAHRGRGIGRLLLSSLIERCEAGPWRQMIAVIADGANTGSTALHQKLGFQHVGNLKAVGFKFGRWIDTLMMQRELSGGSSSLPADDDDASP